MGKSKKGADSETIPVTFPKSWNIKMLAVKHRKYASVQDYVRELVRRDMEAGIRG